MIFDFFVSFWYFTTLVPTGGEGKSTAWKVSFLIFIWPLQDPGMPAIPYPWANLLENLARAQHFPKNHNLHFTDTALAIAHCAKIPDFKNITKVSFLFHRNSLFLAFSELHATQGNIMHSLKLTSITSMIQKNSEIFLHNSCLTSKLKRTKPPKNEQTIHSILLKVNLSLNRTKHSKINFY